ncbi:MAG: 8-oxo-dGTP diphosphatase [Clostridia bacterium]|nr:8-oxo-dGTP diphosphatase [Clostridia bacterium]
MSRCENTILTNMCMVYDSDRVLVQDRLDPRWRGITFPGGHVEKGESFTDSVVREVFEETGLIIEKPRMCGIKSWYTKENARYIVLLYKTDKFSGEIKSSEEGEVFWLDLKDLSKMKLAKDFEDMLKIFTDDDLSEFYYYEENGEWKYSLK